MEITSCSTILIVDVNVVSAAGLRRCLESSYIVRVAHSERQARLLLSSSRVDLLLCYHRPPELDAICLLRGCRVTHPHVSRVLMCEECSPQLAQRCLQEAAVYQYLYDQWQPEQIRLLVSHALESNELARRHRHISRELKRTDNKSFMPLWPIPNETLRPAPVCLEALQEAFEKLVYVSESMSELCKLSHKAAVTDLPVLIQGETGTGKELMARAVHAQSPRRGFPFLAQNCGALPDELLHSELFGHKRGAFTGAVADRLGLFPAADRGTVFLDEISEVSPAFQVSLLRFLQEGEVKALGTECTQQCNVRIIAASNRRLRDLVEQGQFRRDLYYRLCGFELNIPPLRERVEDIPVIAAYVAQKYASSIKRPIMGIAQDVMRCFQTYPFPGNVRELENEIRRMVALAEEGDVLDMQHVSAELTANYALSRAAHHDSAHSVSGEIDPDTRPLANSLDTLGGSLRERVERLECTLVLDALVRHAGNQSRAARELGLSRVGLSNKIRRYKLDAGQRFGVRDFV